VAIDKTTITWIGLIIANIPIYLIIVRILFGIFSDFIVDFGDFISGLVVPNGDGLNSMFFAFKLFVE